jgi:hypothetical protein
MAWVIATAVDAPSATFYRRVAEMARYGPLRANAHAELLKSASRWRISCARDWGGEPENRRRAWEWFLFS